MYCPIAVICAVLWYNMYSPVYIICIVILVYVQSTILLVLSCDIIVWYHV